MRCMHTTTTYLDDRATCRGPGVELTEECLACGATRDIYSGRGTKFPISDWSESARLIGSRELSRYMAEREAED